MVIKILNNACNYATKNCSKVVANYPDATLGALLIAAYIIPRVMDPEGSQTKRPFVNRFFTITLPDNFILAAIMMLRDAPKLTPILTHPPTLLFSLWCIGGLCKVLELGRTGVASLIDKYEHKELAKFIGPRDFYAAQMP